ncbi:enoyl-CoA hydratase [Robbsia sp. Bb-Pol-6]|uniref:Enoyl-CoA hydratase n=2 Tax=Robbsia betulipollinis TaxID=2981849 RepID=A0ABT3ZN01_9BURK|nr:enoyl-CoA hydratase [Robbsia betulipollinis]MCY0387333.1 enoyl-CoA hydratase [Robbsia betulipollinis]
MHQGAVAVLRWNRPGKRNAITAAMYARMADLLAAADADPRVKAIVLGGTGPAFSAGNDIDDFIRHPPMGPDAPVTRFLHVLAALVTPLVAAVRGPAIGVGTTMLLHCDLVYAGSDARFGLPFAQLGLCPEAASSLLLPRLSGHQRAAEKLLLGDPFDAEEARAMGFVNRIVAPEAVEDEALRQAQRLVALPVAALRATKALLKADPMQTVAARIDAEIAQFAALLGGPAAQEALRAFVEKRRPDFAALDGPKR